jgi:hypothetical protein
MATFRDKVRDMISSGCYAIPNGKGGFKSSGDIVADDITRLHEADLARVRAECAAEIDAEARAWAQFPAGPILKALANKIREGK